MNLKPNETNMLLNELLTQVTSAQECGDECKRRNKIEELKAKYESAKEVEEGGSYTLAQARKNYYTYAFGETYYKSMEEKVLRKKADEEAIKLQTLINNEQTDQLKLKDANIDKQQQVSYYMDYLKNIQKNNKGLRTAVNKEENQTHMANRMVYYQTQRAKAFKFLDNFFHYSFRLLLVVLLILTFIYGLYKDWITILFLIGLVIGLFFIPWNSILIHVFPKFSLLD
jgi:hypothetical protein